MFLTNAATTVRTIPLAVVMIEGRANGELQGPVVTCWHMCGGMACPDGPDKVTKQSILEKMWREES